MAAKKVRVGNEIGMICKLCQKHAILPRSGSKILTNEHCMHLRLDKVKQHARSKMHLMDQLHVRPKKFN